MKKTGLYLTILLLVFFNLSCSQNSIVQPDGDILPGSATQDEFGRDFLGFYTVELDPETNTGSIAPNRDLNAHMNAKDYMMGWPCGNCLQVKNLQFLPNQIVECDIDVIHPVNIDMFTVFDLRVIGMFPADQSFNGIGVSTAVQNADGLTNMWDNPAVPGNINSYIAYNKGESRRPFGPGDVFSEHFIVKLPSGAFSYDIGIDASWAPNDGINFPIEMNSFEVINLNGNISAGLTTLGGSATISVTMYDYQGVSTINSVTAFSDDLFLTPYALTFDSGDANEATYTASITNQQGASEGTYNVLVQVTDDENANYPYDISSYVILNAVVLPEVTDVVITLAEDDDYKTVGNFYDFIAFNGTPDRMKIDYLDTDGPWDFTSVTYSGSAQKKILSMSDPEVSSFASDFPGAQHFVKNDGQFGIGAGLYYQAEKHDYAKNTLTPLGLYESESFGGSIVFNGTINGFPYPYNSSTSFSRTFKNTIIIEIFSAVYKTDALGIGLCTIPMDGGTTKSALLLRTTIEAKALGSTVGTVLLYEWYDDDGNILAIIASANADGEPPNWNETTFEITGSGAIMALDSMFRQ